MKRKETLLKIRGNSADENSSLTAVTNVWLLSTKAKTLARLTCKNSDSDFDACEWPGYSDVIIYS